MEDQVGAGIASLRDTAKWLVASSAAVGAALLAGLQLADLRAAEPAWVAIGGYGAAIAAVMGAVWAASEVLRARVLSPSELATAKIAQPLREAVQKDPALLEGRAGDLAGLVAEQQSKHSAADAAWRAQDASEENSDARVAAQSAQDEADVVEDLVKRLADHGLYLATVHTFFRARRSIAGCVLVAAAGIASFAYATSVPDDEATAPSEVTVSLNAEGRRTLRPVLGEGCDLAEMHAVKVAGDDEEPDVVILPVNDCETQRFTVTPVIGTVTER